MRKEGLGKLTSMGHIRRKRDKEKPVGHIPDKLM